MSDHRPRDPLSGFRPTRPPRDLEPRVLAAANEALRSERPPGVWERLWRSRPLRLAWAVTTFALLFAHAALSGLPDPAARSRAAARAEAEELRDLLALPGGEISPRAERRSMVEPAPEKPNDRGVKS